MDTSTCDDLECLSIVDDDAQSYMDEDDVREVRLHHWLSETAGARLLDSTLTRADSPLLGFDHLATQAGEGDTVNKPLPDLPVSISRLRSYSTASSTIAHNSVSRSALLAASAVSVQHRRSPSQNSTNASSPSLSRRPSVARQPSLPLLSESFQESTRLHSITSSLSIGSNRNAVYIDSEQVSSRLDEWLTSGDPEIEQVDDEIQSVSDYYATSFDRPQDSSVMVSTPYYAQGPPPNTPMTAYFTTLASSSQIYLGKTTGKEAQSSDTTTASDQEDVRATPIPHGKLIGPELAVSCSTPASEYSHNSPLFSATTLSTSPTSAGVSSTSVLESESLFQALSSKPSLVSLSRGVLSPKPSASSIGLAYQSYDSTSNMLFPPAAPTASRWSLTSSVAGDAEKDKKKEKEKGGTRKRLVSFISKLAGHNPNKEAKESSEIPIPKPDEVYARGRSVSNASFRENVPFPTVKTKSKSKPPSLKLYASLNPKPVSNPSSPTVASRPSPTSFTMLSPGKNSVTNSTPTPTNPSSVVGSPVSASFTPISPIQHSFTSTRLSVSTSMTTTSTSNASPLMPTTPILTDGLMLTPALKSAVSVPLLSAAYDGHGLIRRDKSFGANTNGSYFGEHAPIPRSKMYSSEDLDLEDDAEYYSRGFSVIRQDPAEEERKARLSVITDMLDRDLNAAPQPNDETSAPEPPPPRRRDSLLYQTKEKVQIDVVETTTTTPSSHSSRASPIDFRKSSSASRTSSPIQRRSVSGPHVISPNVSTPPPLPSKSGFRNFVAARMGISNSLSTPQSVPNPELESKRKSFSSLMSNGKRKRRLVISGAGDGQGEVAALKEWCSSLGEVRSMVRVKNFDGVVADVGEQRQNVWVVDFKKSSVSESVCRLQAKVEIKGAGSVRLSWETAKPKLGFNVGRMGWIP